MGPGNSEISISAVLPSKQRRSVSTSSRDRRRLPADHLLGLSLQPQRRRHAHDPFLGGREAVGLAGAGIGHAEPLFHQVAQLLPPVVSTRRRSAAAEGGLADLLHRAAAAEHAVDLGADGRHQALQLIEVLRPTRCRWGLPARR